MYLATFATELDFNEYSSKAHRKNAYWLSWTITIKFCICGYKFLASTYTRGFPDETFFGSDGLEYWCKTDKPVPTGAMAFLEPTCDFNTCFFINPANSPPVIYIAKNKPLCNHYPSIANVMHFVCIWSYKFLIAFSEAKKKIFFLATLELCKTKYILWTSRL